MLSLSILIPTYNRSDKLLRLLKCIEGELADSILLNNVEVLVSDNCSSDDTDIKIKGVDGAKINLKYYRQRSNIGFDGNVRFLYSAAKTDYVWFFADDDIPAPGAISTVMDALRETTPDILLFSFMQPPGSNVRTFTYEEKITLISDPKEMIRIIARCSKVSMYVARKIKLSLVAENELKAFWENGFYWIDLCFSILSMNSDPRLCIVSEVLASCDDDFYKIGFGSGVILNSYAVYEHSFVEFHFPGMSAHQKNVAYRDAIQFLFALKAGSLEPTSAGTLEDEIRAIKINFVASCMSPRTLIQFVLLKLRLVPLYMLCKRILLPKLSD